MKIIRVFYCAAIIIFWAGTTFAMDPIPIIKLYSDSSLTDTTVIDTTTGILTVYVVIENYPGVTATQFKIEGSNGFTGVWIGETVQVGNFLGVSYDGIAFNFLTCLHPPIHILTINYSMSGTSLLGSFLEVVPDPDFPILIVCDCSQDTCLYPVNAEGGRLYVTVGLVPVQSTTWGKVKYLFR